MNGLAFVGRVAELTRLEEVVEACRRGERAVAFLGGEAGIGKTRLVTELAERAMANGAEVFVGSCLDLDHGGLPHTPIVEALRELADEPDATDPLDGDTELVDGPASALQVVQRALAHLGDRRVAVLIVEDVQWANRSTRDLIAYLASTGPTPPLALVSTYRSDDLGPGHPLRAFVAELERRPNVTHLRLDRLGRADAAALLAATLGRPPDPAMTEAMYQRSEGNPFFLQELGRATASEPSGELPPLLSDVLTSRVRRLSTGTQRVLRIAAVAGRRVDHDRLAAIVPLDPTMLTDALREARDANIITTDPDLRHYEFCHALLHEAVYADVLAGERSLYHTAYAELLAAEPGRRGLEAWAALSHHWRAAGRSREALVATIEAGMAAEAWYATPEAHRYYELALELWSELDAPVAESVPTRLDVLSRAADAASRTGAFARAVELTNTALADIDPTADPTSAGLLHERQAWFLWRAGQEEQALDEYRAAVRMVPAEPPSAARARVLAAYADALERSGVWAVARRYAEEAVAIASAVGAAFDEGHARHVLGLALGAEGDTDEGIAELHRSRLLAEANGDVADVAGTYVHLWRVLAEQRRGDELVQVAGGAADACHAAGMELAGRLLDCLAGGFLSQLGRWQEAEERLQVEKHDLWGLLAVANPTVRGLLEVDRGDLGAAREHLETARCLGVQMHDGRIYGLLYRGLAELALWEGRVDDARAAVATGLQLTGDDEMAARLCSLGLRAAADLADRERAEAGSSTVPAEVADLVARLARLDARAESRHAPVASEVRAAAATGWAEQTRVEGHADPDRWAEAARRWEGLGFPAPVAYCRWRQAAAVLADGRRADAIALWKDAHDAAAELGAGTLRRAIELEASRAAIPLFSSQPDGEVEIPFGLTPRELEVLTLVAAGLTNRQIGEALFISEKTASVHVSRILAKLGARSRAQAAAMAGQLGLTGQGRPTRTK